MKRSLLIISTIILNIGINNNLFCGCCCNSKNGTKEDTEKDKKGGLPIKPGKGEPTTTINEITFDKNKNITTFPIEGFQKVDNLNELNIINKIFVANGNTTCWEISKEIYESIKENKTKFSYDDIPTPYLMAIISTETNYYFIYCKNADLIKDAHAIFMNLPTSVKEIIIIDNGKIKNAANMFYCCKAENIDVKRMNTSSFENMECMFLFCKNLKTIDVSNFTTDNVTNMNSMFNGCASLEEIKGLAKFNYKNVTTMAEMFKGCTNLSKGLKFSNYIENCTNFNKMFEACKNIITLNLTNFDFSKCAEQTSVNFLFGECEKLKKITFYEFDPQNNVILSNVFFNCNALNEIKHYDKANDTVAKILINEGFTKIEKKIEKGKESNWIIYKKPSK